MPKDFSLDQGDIAPDFEANSTQGPIRFHEWIEGRWTLLTTHPTAYTAVCSTELVAEAREIPKLLERDVRALTLSEGRTEEHLAWSKDLTEASGVPIDFPIVEDPDFSIGEAYGILAPRGSEHGFTRTAIIIDPDKVIRWSVTYPPRTGRNFDEVIRVLDSLRITDELDVATPAEWHLGDPVLVPTKESTEDAEARFGAVDSRTPFMRTADPSALLSATRAGDDDAD